MKITTLFLALLLLASCGETNDSQKETKDENTIWTQDEYSLSELILLFQNWIPADCLKDKVLWMNNASWEDFKLNTAAEIDQKRRYLPWKEDSIYQTPALYVFYMIGTLDRYEENEDFFTNKWDSTYAIESISGEFFESSKSADWLESMSVNYSEEKCARMLDQFVTDYLNDDAMLPEWKEEKERWLVELRKLQE